MKNKKILIIVAICILLVIAFLLIPYILVQSHTATNSTVASSNKPPENEKWCESGSSLAVILEGASSLNPALKKALQEKIISQSEFSQVIWFDSLDRSADMPTIAIRFTTSDIKWTPFYATGYQVVEVAFSSIGDVSFRNSKPTHFTTFGDVKVTQFIANLEITDKSAGIISLPGYHQYLAQKVADAIMKIK